MPHDNGLPTITVVPLLWVKNMAQAIRFYQDVGFEVTESWKPDKETQWCCVEFQGAALMLQKIENFDTEQQKTSEDNGIQLYFITDDVDALYRQMCANGIDVSPPKIEFYGMKQVFLKDPDGRTLCFESLVSACGHEREAS